MHKIASAIPIAASVLAISISVFALTLAERGDEARGRDASQVACREDVRALDQRIAKLAERLHGLEGLERTVAELAANPSARSGPAQTAADSPDSLATTEAGDGSALAADAAKDGAFKDLVRSVISEDREERRVAAERRREERTREMQELSKGPYGQNNYKVNSLARTLSLSDFQKQAYHDNLVALQRRGADLRRGVNWQDTEARRKHRADEKAQEEEFENTIVRILSPEQAEAFRELPPWERGASGGDMVFFDEERIEGEEGTEIVQSATRVLISGATVPGPGSTGLDLGARPGGGGLRIELPFPLPPPLPEGTGTGRREGDGE